MKIFALSDPHLSRGVEGKKQDVFGPHWQDHDQKIEQNWRRVVGDRDLVLVPGDISWAMRPDEAAPDLHFLDQLPGVKVLIRGNHDYWWSSLSKVRRLAPPTLHVVDGDALCIHGVGICGTRLWESPEISFSDLCFSGQLDSKGETNNDVSTTNSATQLDRQQHNEKIFRRETARLQRSLAAMEELASRETIHTRVVMTHYPPCDASLGTSRLTDSFEEHHIHHVVFGHLHNLRRDLDPPPFGARNGVAYHLCSCDYLDFTPRLINAGGR